jgi:hypothetical protein
LVLWVPGERQTLVPAELPREAVSLIFISPQGGFDYTLADRDSFAGQ